MSKKIISLALIATLLVSLFAAQVFAEEAKSAQAEEKIVYTLDEIEELPAEAQKEFRAAEADLPKLDTGDYVAKQLLFIQIDKPTAVHVKVNGVSSARVYEHKDGQWEIIDSMFNTKTHELSFYAEKPVAVEVVAPPAAPSPVAAKQNAGKTASLPEIANDTLPKGDELVALHNAAKLNAKQQKNLKDALDALPGAVTDDYSARYFFYSKMAKPADVDFALANAKDAKVLQFVDGEWNGLAATLDGGVLSANLSDAPTAILTK